MNKQSRTNQNCKITFVIFAIIALAGLCFGIYGTVQANQALNILHAAFGDSIDDLELIEESDTFGLPASADSIDYITVDYNNYDNSFVIDSLGSIETYSPDSEDGTITEVDTSELINYAFTNIASNLGEYSSLDDESWVVTVYAEEGTSYINGEGEMPEWLNQFISKINDTIKTGTIVEE